MKVREIWRRVLATRYTSALENEVARLRAENRALLNSILGIAGVPPIVVSTDESGAQAATTIHSTAPDGRVANGAGGSTTTSTTSAAAAATVSPMRTKQNGTRTAGVGGMKNVATPTRRRSWHQVYRMLEIAAARKKESA